MAVATPTEIASVITTLNAGTALNRLALTEANAVFTQMASLGFVLYEPASTGQVFCAGYGDYDTLIQRLASTSPLGRLSNVECQAVFARLAATGFLVTKAPLAAPTAPSSVTETTTTLAANVPALIAPAAPGITKLLVIVNNGTGSLVWKTNSPPASASDGTPLDPASAAGGQGGSVILTGDYAISDPLYAWSTAGTTVNVKQS